MVDYMVLWSQIGWRSQAVTTSRELLGGRGRKLLGTGLRMDSEGAARIHLAQQTLTSMYNALRGEAFC
eukprot:11357073-Karenia_brevis.AAC.1